MSAVDTNDVGGFVPPVFLVIWIIGVAGSSRRIEILCPIPPEYLGINKATYRSASWLILANVVDDWLNELDSLLPSQTETATVLLD